jgi:hypothetical protein
MSQRLLSQAVSLLVAGLIALPIGRAVVPPVRWSREQLARGRSAIAC